MNVESIPGEIRKAGLNGWLFFDHPEHDTITFGRWDGCAWGKVQTDYHRVIAEPGYPVVPLDHRATPAPKGAAWRRAVFGSLGPLSTEEQAAALRELARTRSYVDASRVAIWGWSGGGSNTLNAMFREPDLYQVGITA